MVSALFRRTALALVLACVAAPAWSQAPYPAKTVRLVVPFPPGQAADIFGRMVAERLAATWGQSVVVENRGVGWSGTQLPAGTPREIVERGAVPDPRTPQAYTEFIRVEIEKWKEVAKAANVKLD